METPLRLSTPFLSVSATRYASVIDLGFGDSGKGLFVDALTRRWQAHTVARFSGGAQAGHNVVTSSQHHTFSQFGAGTFVPGTRTVLLDPFVLHPTALLIEAEAAEEARERAEAAADRIRSVAGVEPEIVVHEGVPSEEIVALIEADEDISLLILAAGTGSDGPGPLVSSLAGKSAGSFAVPIAIVPGHLSDRDIDTLS